MQRNGIGVMALHRWQKNMPGEAPITALPHF